MASDIIISTLTATGVVGGVALLTSWDDSVTGSCLPYRQPSKYRWYASTTNTKPSTPSAETVLPMWNRTGLTGGSTWYHWVEPVDSLGNVGAAFPTTGGGRVATVLADPASQADLGAAVLEYKALVSSERQQRISADGALASDIDDVQATAQDAQTKAIVATANARIEMRANVSGSSAASYVDIMASRTIGGAKSFSGLRITTPSSGPSSVDVRAGQFRLLDWSDNPVFLVDGNGDLSANTIKSKRMFLGENGLYTELVRDNAISAMEVSGRSNLSIVSGGNKGQIKSEDINLVGAGGRVLIMFFCQQTLPGTESTNHGEYTLALRRGSTVLTSAEFAYDDDITNAPSLIYDDASNGSIVEYNVTLNVNAIGGSAVFRLNGMQIILIHYKK